MKKLVVLRACGVPGGSVATGSVLSARRVTRAVAPLLLAGLALGACSDDEPTAAPTPSTSPSVTASETASPTPTPTETATATASPSATPSPTPATTTATPSATPAPKPTTAPRCAAATAGKVNTSGMPAAGAEKARRLHAAALKCDSATLVALAKADSTGLVGDQAPSAVFTAKSPQNFVALATLLSMPATESFDGTIQPRVFSEQFARSDAEWDKVVSAGLLTRAQATTMRQDDGGYTGYRIGIASDGTWTFFTTGR